MQPKSKTKQYQEFEGEFFVLDEKSGYWYNTKTRERMHRYVYRHYYGDIPVGFHIHHIDGNKANNEISNLALLSPSAHLKLHGAEWTEERRDKLRTFVAEIRPLTKAWHASEEGIAWHRTHYEKTKAALHEKVECVCDNCGKLFVGIKRSTHRFCCNACKSAWRRKQGLDCVTVVCAFCGKEFEANKYKPRKYCSRGCANKAKAA